MKEKRAFPWQWCPQPERMKVTRSRPTDKAWIPLMASALILSLLAIQGVQVFTPSAVNAFNPGSYGAVLPTAQPTFQTPSQTPQASQTQTTTSVSTDHFTVQFSFPESADPGNAITISTITTAKSNGRIVSLTIDVFSYVDNQLVKSASEAIATDKDVGSGDNWQTSLVVVIPTNAQRGPLFGTVTEVWQEASNYYSSDYSSNYYANYNSGYYTNYNSGYCLNYPPSYYPNYDTTRPATRTNAANPKTSDNDTTQTYPTSQTYPTLTTPYNYTTSLHKIMSQSQPTNQPRYVHQPGYVYEPSYVCEPAGYYGPNGYYGTNNAPYNAPYYASSYATQVSSEQTFPLTYVLATTPEYVELQKTNEQLQKDYNDTVAKNNDLSSKYNSLKADYDQTVAKYNQTQSDYNSASQELGNYKISTYVLIVLAAVLVIALVFVAVFQRRPVVKL